MEKKNNLFKSIFYIFFAFCFLSVGFMTITKGHTIKYAVAEESADGTIDNSNLPSYFSAEEFIKYENGSTETNLNSLIGADTFMYFKENTTSNYLKLSLITNGGETEPINEIYNYVYYPDPSDISVFYFYNINSVTLHINGEYKEINMGDYIFTSGLSFANKNTAQLEQFSMIFNDTGAESNAIKITDDTGKVVEGIYTLSLSYTLYSCTDGGTTVSETAFSDYTPDPLKFSFYVVDQNNYFFNNKPNIDKYNFDHEVPVSNLTNPKYAYYLYSNYSSEETLNKIPYIEYDYTRYDVTINKTISNTVYSSSLIFDPTASSPVSLQGEEVVNILIDESANLCKVYFTNVGDYDISLHAIQVVDYYTSESGTQTRKFHLNGMTNITKKLMVYMYGYQTNYTDLDRPTDSNNIRPVSELKEYDFKNSIYKNSADITSSFLASNTSYSQETGNTTFLISNVLNYINNNAITPVKTNQTPIKLSVNATLSTAVNSYILSTTKVSDSYSTYNGNIVTSDGTEALYRATFTGKTDSTAGKYIYIIAYTYKNYYLTETTLSANTVFYQVFYFEIIKDLPTIQIQTSTQGKNVSSDTFVNENVNIVDTTKNDPYNKDVTIQVYAYDYSSKSYLQGFGGEQGISFNALKPTDSTENFITLEKSAFYTVRLYYSNEITSENILYSSKKGYFREQTFTIDKNPIQNIRGRNVSEIINSTDYKISSLMTTFTTNQNMILSWDEKESGANTYAYYRYFPIVEEQYYSNREGILSTTLDRLLNYTRDSSYLPVNYLLNMETRNNNWLLYTGNTNDFKDRVSTEYVFTDSGLYLVDVYDEAGNHTVEVFMIDTTTPVFAIYDGTSYTLTSSSIYVTTPSTLFWAKYKSIFVTNFKTLNYQSVSSLDYITVENLKYDGTNYYDFYTTYDKTPCVDIFKVMYNKLFSNNYLQMIDISITPTPEADGTSSMIDGYSGLYVTLPINDLSFFMDKDNPNYTAQTGIYHKEINVTEEMTYKVLIRDLSNTKYDLNYTETAEIQYTNYYSARQTIIISFDSSEFFIEYTDNKGDVSVFSSNNYVEGTITTENADGTTTQRKTKTTYLSPTSMNKAFTLSFLPTITGEDLLIQVDTVTIKYYPYIEKTITVGGITYHYYDLSSEATEIEVYNFEENGSMTTLKEDEIRLNAENITTAGKYEISRRYYIEDGYSYNENDYFERTYFFYVDRNEVVTNAELVSDKDEDGNVTSSHLESLVGGDVFVAMYNNKTNASLVVTFPNSEVGNSNGSSIYNNGNVRSVLTTNMLPVYVYVPQTKYTMYAQKVEKTNSYDFKVENNDSMNKYTEDMIIREYYLYAEIYKDGLDTSNLVAITSTNKDNPTFNTVTASSTGFLNFYNYQTGNQLQYLSESGTYYVKIYQGRFGVETGDKDKNENSYEQCLTFCFDINKSNPDFIAQSITGSSLNSTLTNPVPTDDTKPSVTYYTNQSIVSLLWDAGNTYMADIDIEKITFKTSKGNTYTASDDVWSVKPTLSNSSYFAQINLQKLGIYTNNGFVDITMQYKNHDSEFYSRVTKRIYVDLSAPSTNVQALVENSIKSNLITALTNASLRTYYTANMQNTAELGNTSYNVSNNTGTFAYYSYTVTSNYLQTLKNSLSSDVHITYIRAFTDAQGNNTKYTANAEQETSPTDFLPSNFTDITNVSTLAPNTYYEIIETDRAGNMSIYTIYITNYNETQNDNNNLISYTDAEGNEDHYSIEDYALTQTYQGATHNIYAKTGFQLQEINFFGDEWTQFRLDTLNANGFTTTKYLMLTPWDKDYAYAFVGSNFTKIAIIDLIDGMTSSRYKNCISIYNRENTTTTNFYINIRNTTLTATLTDNQAREYIRFSKPTDDAIKNSIYSSTYITSLKITANGELLYDAKNKLGFSSLWQSNASVIVTADDTMGSITFEINPDLGFTPNTRIVYEYTDNYNTSYKEIHLYKETIISREISSQQDLYSYYDTNGGRLYYITKNGFKYSYNPSKYTVSLYDLVDGIVSDHCDNASYETALDSQGISTISIETNRTESNYNDAFALEIRDFNDANNLVKTIYFILYNELPIANYTNENNAPGEFKILDANGNNITKNIIDNLSNGEAGYFSEIRILYSNKETFIPIKYSISTDKLTWTEISSGTRLKCLTETMEKYYLKVWYDETYLKNELGTHEYVFGYVPDGDGYSQIYEFNLSSMTSTFWIEKTINGVTTTVEKNSTTYKTLNGSQYSNHYIVNLNYSDRNFVEIKTNKEQEITATLVETFYDTNTVVSEHWIISNTANAGLVNIPAFNTDIIITYIPNSDNFVDEFYTYNLNGIIDTTENLVNETSKSIVISTDYSSITRIELQWTKYYGIGQNEINLRLIKDGIELDPVVYTRTTKGKSYSYVYLTHSGKYLISLYDNAGNVQKFNRGNAGQTESFSLIFLKDVPFTVTYANVVTGELETTLPIKQAVYNGEVTLKIDKNTRSEFYSLDGYPVINVKKNGKEYTGTFQDDTTYIFNEPGYYEVSFTATSNLPDVGTIRQETCQFTILNANEYRYSYIYNRYSNYYVERVIKDDVDITETLIKTLDVSTITVNGQHYMTELPLSYLDEKTGAGNYLITINSNDRLFKNSTAITSFTYRVVVQVGTAPMKISIAEGEKTTDTITIAFNQANIYREMGECSIRILRYSDDTTSTYFTLNINETTTQEASTQITESGDFYIQIVSPSGNLLYSYKVIKNDPLNAAAIIAIIVGVLVAIVVIFLIIKLRKRITVK